jgi:hypothetical protein
MQNAHDRTGLSVRAYQPSERSRGNGVRTFDEIGQLLGITAGCAQKCYSSGMAKLHSRRLTPLFQKLIHLVESREALGAERSASVLSCRAAK